MLNSLLRCFIVSVVTCGQAVTSHCGERDLRFERPELVAVMWAPENSPIQYREAPKAAWRPDGTSIPAEELQWLFESRNLVISQVSRVAPTTLRPLVVVFRVDERARTPLRLNVTAVINDVPLEVRDPLFDTWPATSTEHHLFSARISPPPLAAWPEKINFEVRTQVAEPTVLHVLDAAKATACTLEKPLEVDRGVTWGIGPRPLSRNKGAPGTAAVLTIDRHVAQADADWTAEVTLTTGAHVEVRQVTRAGSIVEYVYELPESEIAQVVLKRRRYRTERYEQVPVRNELLSR